MKGLTAFAGLGVDQALLRQLIAEQEAARPGYEKLWAYYRPSSGAVGAGPSAGLPARLRTGAFAESAVLENDIAWRIDAMVDFVFGQEVKIQSTAEDPEIRRRVEAALDAAWEESGGLSLMQDMALLGAVYGFVDLVVRAEGLLGAGGSGAVAQGSLQRPSAPAGPPAGPPRGLSGVDRIVNAARRLRVEVVEAPRALPIVDPADYRRLVAYGVRAERELNELTGSGGSGGVVGRLMRGGGSLRRKRVEAIELIGPSASRLWVGGELVGSMDGGLGVLPVVHIQNTSQPYAYAGLSDVSPMVPLQDELNTRLSDRAHRVTMQSFQMYLAKGVESLAGGEPMVVGPGQVWSTDNPDAAVEAFGGDMHAPSEEQHIQEVRDSMDKLSGVSPVVLGLLRARIGHLSSENALRVTLMGVLNKAERKRRSYGRGIVEASGLMLMALDRAGVLKTREEDRGLALRWSDPLPVDEVRRLTAARMKVELGVPAECVLGELGYGGSDGGVL